MGFTMAVRRSSQVRSTYITSASHAPYDLNRPVNWTVEKLRGELRRNNVTFHQSDNKECVFEEGEGSDLYS